MIRDTVSGEPPGANPKTQRTGRWGKSSGKVADETVPRKEKNIANANV